MSLKNTPIFRTYTGNAFLNNALMAIEAAANLSHVSEITPSVLLNLFDSLSLADTNSRLKNYTIIFSRNGPLLNDSKNGKTIYSQIIKEIINEQDNNSKGKYLCEVSGLEFDKPFELLYEQALRKINFTDKEIQNKDLSISRCWFPLIGSLGSDAQALPQAKYSIKVHPICLAIIQFLPLSSVLYKGGVLLIDSSSFDFSRDLIKRNYLEIKSKIAINEFENIKYSTKDSKSYLITALSIYGQKIRKDNFTELYLWSFSNSGTGAKCSIDRIPNELFNKVLILKSKSPSIRTELERFLAQDGKSSLSILECIKDNRDFENLYPKFVSKKLYEGSSVYFFEEYQKLIGVDSSELEKAKYIAKLIKDFADKTKQELKLLEKTDAFKENEYKILLKRVLKGSTKEGKWNLSNYLSILVQDEESERKSHIIKLNFQNSFLKKVHFYYLKDYFDNNYQILSNQRENRIWQFCNLIYSLIKNDISKKNNSYDSINNEKLLSLFIRQAKTDLSLGLIRKFCFDEIYKLSIYSLKELLEIFLIEKTNSSDTLSKEIEWNGIYDEDQNLKKYKLFADDYLNYYLEKYKNPSTNKMPFSKFQSHVINKLEYIRNHSSNPLSNFVQWLEEAISKLNNLHKKEQYYLEDFIYDENGNKIIVFAHFATEFLINKSFWALKAQGENITNQLITTND